MAESIGARFKELIGKITRSHSNQPPLNESPTKALVQADIQPVPYEERYAGIVPEIARVDTKLISQTIDPILTTYFEQCEKEDKGERYESILKRGTYTGWGGSGNLPGHDFGRRFIGVPKVFSGLGDGSFKVARSMDGTEPGSRFATLLGMDGVSDYLEVGLHTDDKTSEALTELIKTKPDMRFFGRTFYIIAPDGRMGKLVYLPREIPDDRTFVDLNYFDHSVLGPRELYTQDPKENIPIEFIGKLVPATITPTDFEIIFHGLAAFRNTLKNPGLFAPKINEQTNQPNQESQPEIPPITSSGGLIRPRSQRK